MGQNRAQRQIFQKTKGNVQIKKWSKIWSFRAKNWPKIAKKRRKTKKKARKGPEYEILKNWAEN